jgi:sugar-specific transcriptional regulator TrmB
MKSYVRLALATVFTVLLVAGFAQAQPRVARGRVYTKADVDRIIKRVEDSTDKFKKEFDKALDRSRLNNTNREDQLNEYAKGLEHATDDLRKHFDKTDAWIENKEQVRTCLSLASKINVAMRNRRLGPKAENRWASLRYDLNTLAGVYDLPLVGAPAY